VGGGGGGGGGGAGGGGGGGGGEMSTAGVGNLVCDGVKVERRGNCVEPVLNIQCNVFRQTAQGTYGASRPLPTVTQVPLLRATKRTFSISCLYSSTMVLYKM